MVPYPEFERNAALLERRIALTCLSCGRDRQEVVLMAVTKSQPVAAIEYACRFGLSAIGENRVQEAAAKRPESSAAIQWEMIGHLQSNKARLAVSLFDRIQSVDSMKLARALDRCAGEVGKRMPVLIQVNAGEDPRKFGVGLEEARETLDVVLSMSNLRVDGLMTIAPFAGGRSAARPAFDRLRALRDKLRESTGLDLSVLSMGMTGDLEEAIEAGSTCLRVGTALFGGRQDKRHS